MPLRRTVTMTCVYITYLKRTSFYYVASAKDIWLAKGFILRKTHSARPRIIDDNIRVFGYREIHDSGFAPSVLFTRYLYRTFSLIRRENVSPEINRRLFLLNKSRKHTFQFAAAMLSQGDFRQRPRSI